MNVIVDDVTKLGLYPEIDFAETAGSGPRG